MPKSDAVAFLKTVSVFKDLTSPFLSARSRSLSASATRWGSARSLKTLTVLRKATASDFGIRLGRRLQVAQRVTVIGPALGGPALDEGRLERPRLLRPGGDHELGDSLENRGPLFRAQLILGQHGVGGPDQG